MRLYKFQQAKKDLPKRVKTDNKYAAGKSLVIAGSTGMYGAAILAARACSRVGSGFVYVFSKKDFPILKNPDFLTLTDFKKIDFAAIAIGPGLKNDRLIKRSLEYFYKNKIKNVVLDAEAINYISKNRKTKLWPSWIMTPHEGELARLLDLPSRKIKADRLKYLKLAQKTYKTIILLKGHQTLIDDGKNTYRVMSGNVALAKAGTGDVLTGMITGFLSQKVSNTEAACLAAFLHGVVADEWIKSKNDILSLTATDIINNLPKILYQVRKGSR